MQRLGFASFHPGKPGTGWFGPDFLPLWLPIVPLRRQDLACVVSLLQPVREGRLDLVAMRDVHQMSDLQF